MESFQKSRELLNFRRANHFRGSLTRNFRFIWFLSEISRSFGWIVRFSKIPYFLFFLENFPGNQFRIMWPFSIPSRRISGDESRKYVSLYRLSRVLRWNKLSLCLFFAFNRVLVFSLACTNQWNKIWMPRECHSI